MHNNDKNYLTSTKNFKETIKRLFIELKNYKKLIIISLVLAFLSSILSIFTPNKLSDLTDEISQGLIPNTKNIEIITNKVTESISKENLSKMSLQILNIDLSQNTINEIMISDDITLDEKNSFKTFINNLNNSDSTIELLSLLPDNVLKKILKPSSIDNNAISSEDKILFLKIIQNKNIMNIPDSIKKLLFKEFYIDNTLISSSDQINYLTVMSSLKESTDSKILYSLVDKLPSNIQKVIKPSMDLKSIKNISILLMALYILSALCMLIESLSMTSVSNNFAKNLRSRISNKINKLPLKYFDKHLVGDTLSRITNDVDTVAQSMNESLSSLVSASALFIGTIVMMFYTNCIMAITAIISSTFGFIFMGLILSKSQKYFVTKQKELGLLNGHIEEVYSGLNVVKAYNGKKDANKKFDMYNESVYKASRKSQFLSGLMMPMMGFIGNFGYVAVCIVGASLVIKGNITFGVIVAFMSYVRLFTSPLSQIAGAFTSLQSTAAASERVFEFLDTEEMKNENGINKYLKKENVKGKIEFENVSFTYEGNDKQTIKNFSAVAMPCQKVAIVGPTGAGKTTMVNLLMKFYDITSGDIKIDGVSIKELTRENIHDLFTMVLQDTWLFNGTVKDNIKYNKKNITDDKVKEVCKVVGLDHFIKTLPNNYDSVLNDGESISSGQKQLLTLARGMIDNSPFIILDEATSNVDTRTEELVASAMDKLTKNRTSFIIAHRLSTIKNADLILVMKDGNIIEQGTHNELMQKKSFYAKLYNSQFEL